MSNKLYFAYGSNLSLSQMQNRCKTSFPVAPAELDNYKITFKANKRGNGVADIVKCEGSTVLGAVYNVSENDIKMLDKFEGNPIVYKRQKVKVRMNGREVEALTYIMDSKFKPKAPNDEYLQRIVSGYKDWNLPKANLIEAVKLLKGESK